MNIWKYFLVIILLFTALISNSVYPKINEINEILSQKYHLPKMDVNFDENEIQRQGLSLANQVSFIEAFQLAMDSFINDNRHEESPLALIHEKDQLLSHLNRPKSEIKLLKTLEAPENVESPKEFWIFFLKIPSLSDHLFWALVHRQKKIPVYNYGFN